MGVGHPYTDAPTSGIKVLSYDYEEVFAEKMRALLQRLRPRDLYDVVHLHRRLDLKPDRAKVIETFKKKCDLRGAGKSTLETIRNHANRALLESEWEGQLRHQIPVLPSFESFLGELPAVFDWLGGEEVVALESITAGDVDTEESTVISEAVDSLTLPGPLTSYLDRIRFAAANRLEIRLGYDGSFRAIEPYALARSSDGNLLLRAIRTTGESRTYRFDRIESLTVTEKSFAPRYAIEITSDGHLPVHQLSRQPSIGNSRRRVDSGPTYVFRCTQCKKLFERKSMDPTLKPHKNSQGRQCYGSHGAYVKTEH